MSWSAACSNNSTIAEHRLIAAMHEVERLIEASMITCLALLIRPPLTHAGASRTHVAELGDRFEAVSARRSASRPTTVLTRSAGLLRVAHLRGRPIGCGAPVPRRPPGRAEANVVSPDARGLGLGCRPLRELEQDAAAPPVPAPCA
jgi:hypothetical protein